MRNIVSSFSYDYTEEVHGSYSLEDGEIGNKDPISGFHNLIISGKMESVSLGYARSGSAVDFGVGYHFIPGSSINERLWIDTLSTNNDNLSSVVAHNKTYNTDSDIKYSLGLNIHFNDRTNFLFSFISNIAWDQPPGEEPISNIFFELDISLNFFSISSILNAALET